MQSFQEMEKSPARGNGIPTSASIQVMIHDVLASLPENLACNCFQIQIRGPDGISRACHRPDCCLTLHHLKEDRNNKVEPLCRDASLPFAATANAAYDKHLGQQASVPALVAAPASNSDLQLVPRTLPQEPLTYQLFDSQVVFPPYGSAPSIAQVSPSLYVYEVPSMTGIPQQEPAPVQIQTLQQTHLLRHPEFHQQHRPAGPALSPYPSGPLQAHNMTEYSQSMRSSTPPVSYPGSLPWSISQLMQRQSVLHDMNVDSDGSVFAPANGLPVHRSAATPSPQQTTWPQRREQLHHSELYHSEQVHPQEQQRHPSPRPHHSTDSSFAPRTFHTGIPQCHSDGHINLSQVVGRVGPSARPQEAIYRCNSPQSQRQGTSCTGPSVYHDASQRSTRVETVVSTAMTHEQPKSALLGTYLGSLHYHQSDLHPSPQQSASGAFCEERRQMHHVAAAEGYPHDYLSMTSEATAARNTIKTEDEIEDSRTGVLLFVAPHLADTNSCYGSIADVNTHQSDHGREDNHIRRNRNNTIENDQDAFLGGLPLCLDQYTHQSNLREVSTLVGDGNTRPVVRRKNSRMSVLEDENVVEQQAFALCPTAMNTNIAPSSTSRAPIKKKSSTLTLKAGTPSSSSSSIAFARKALPMEAYTSTFMAVPPEILKSTSMLSQSSPSLVLENFEPFSKRGSSNIGSQ